MRRVLRAPLARTRPLSACDEHTLGFIRELYPRVHGNVVRLQELLLEEQRLQVPYSTLTRWIREAELRPAPTRAGHYEFAPGAEMQHDTSPHRFEIGGKMVTAQCASLVLAYSRLLYMQYYPAFTRFEAKTFLSAAFDFMGGTCPRCVIDNTNVVLASGSGSDAQIAPEMAAFARMYGVEFFAHAIGHSDRKARVERPFHYIENNFLAGRVFSDWQNLNQQALRWCEQIANAKPKRVLGMSPQAAYVQEKPHLIALPGYRPPIYQTHYRVVDIEAYIALDTNHYSVPERLIGKKVEVHKYPLQVKIFWRQKPVAEHARLIGRRQGRVTTPGHHEPLARQRTYRGPCIEEQALIGEDELLDRYVIQIKKRAPGRGVVRLRRLLALKRDYPRAAFLGALEQAMTYGLYDLERLEQLILERVAGDFFCLNSDEEDQ